MNDLTPMSGPQGPLIRGGQTAPSVPDEWGVKRFLANVQTSLDVSTPYGKAMVLAALKDDCIPGKDTINTELDLKDWLIHPVESQDEETGEVRRYVRTCLVLADGKIVAFGSQGVLKDLQLICGLERPAPWEPPLRVRVRSRSIGNNRQWYCLDLVRAEPAAGDKRKPR